MRTLKLVLALAAIAASMVLTAWLCGDGGWLIAPMFYFTTSIAAGAEIDVLNNPTSPSKPWKYNRAPYKCTVELIANTTATGVVQQVTSGSDEIVQAGSPLTAGGTANVCPGRLNVEPITFTADPGDVISASYRNTTGGALVVSGSIELTPRA